MISFPGARLGVALAAGAVFFAGCGGHMSVPGAPGGLGTQSSAQARPGSAELSPQSVVEPVKAPRKCSGQTTASKDATDTETLQTSGGSLCIPAFGGYGGSIKYPPVTTSTSITLESSTTNVGGYPSLGPSGTPIFYLHVAIAGATSFGKSGTAGGGLESPNIVAGNSYTVYAQGSDCGATESLPKYTTVATSSTHGGKISGIGAALKGVTVPCPGATAILEVYNS